MPDMQTALGKALEEGKRRFLSATLSEWDEHEQTIRQPQPPQEKAMQPQTTTVEIKPRNMRHDAFALVKSNPHRFTAKEALNKLAAMGYKPNSLHTLLVQMKKAGMFSTDANSKLYTLTETYQSFSNPYNPTYKKPKKIKPAGIAALAVPEPEKKPVQIVMHMTAEKVLASIGVAEAHKLYMELSKMFGGAR